MTYLLEHPYLIGLMLTAISTLFVVLANRRGAWQEIKRWLNGGKATIVDITESEKFRERGDARLRQGKGHRSQAIDEYTVSLNFNPKNVAALKGRARAYEDKASTTKDANKAKVYTAKAEADRARAKDGE